jgi:glucosamine--fructose-6-phosphate aminotransferase (isomerizing)
LGARAASLTLEGERESVSQLIATPGQMAEMLNSSAQIEPVARDVARAESVLYLGRGPAFPLAMEGALKLEELSYIHAEGYAAGELKHGPIALIDYAMPVIVLRAAGLSLREDGLQSSRSRCARRSLNSHWISVSKKSGCCRTRRIYRGDQKRLPGPFSVLVYAVVVQLLAYHVAVFMGKDVDQPRNLAKSVTVE